MPVSDSTPSTSVYHYCHCLRRCCCLVVAVIASGALAWHLITVVAVTVTITRDLFHLHDGALSVACLPLPPPPFLLTLILLPRAYLGVASPVAIPYHSTLPL